ncbi:MAG: hypothetical protein K9I85_15040 [Saprospiraceae bacterium]|nr:hypothetical protein [Saprospiraceae bacterium]
MQGRYGPFSILRPERKPNGWIEDWHQDSISLEVLELQRLSESLLDSLEQLRKKCETIIYNQSESPSTRTIALNTLRQVFNPSEYANPFFEEYSNMSWGLLEDINEPECLSCDRDLLSGWYVGRFNIEKWNEDPIFRNWNLIPVIIEYWGDPLWNQSNTNHYTGTMLEQMIFKQLLQGYDRSDLLLEFIQANVKDPNTIILKKLKEDLD